MNVSMIVSVSESISVIVSEIMIESMSESELGLRGLKCKCVPERGRGR